MVNGIRQHLSHVRVRYQVAVKAAGKTQSCTNKFHTQPPRVSAERGLSACRKHSLSGEVAGEECRRPSQS